MDSFDNGTKSGMTASDLSSYLKRHRQKQMENGGGGQQLYAKDVRSYDDTTIESNGYIQNPAYVIQGGPKSQYSVGGDTSSKGVESTFTNGQSTVRDDHGNNIPQNAKLILGYKNMKHRRGKPTATPGDYGGGEQHQHNNQVFPSIQPSNSNHASNSDQMEKRLRELAGQLSSDWRGSIIYHTPALARRLRDFQFARDKRRKKYGTMKPWGILGLYDHLSGVRVDVEWAEDAAWRRKNGEPYLTWSDFEGIKNSGNHRPFFTFAIVSACTAMMFAALSVNGWKFEPLSVNPMIGPSAETLLRLGAKESYLIVQENEIWRLVSPMVLHAGVIHFLLNMFALWYVGKAIEQIHGFFPAVVQFVVPAGEIV
jgi:hypothetical protein